jgi:hypothetical protein
MWKLYKVSKRNCIITLSEMMGRQAGILAQVECLLVHGTLNSNPSTTKKKWQRVLHDYSWSIHEFMTIAQSSEICMEERESNHLCWSFMHWGERVEKYCRTVEGKLVDVIGPCVMADGRFSMKVRPLCSHRDWTDMPFFHEDYIS